MANRRYEEEMRTLQQAMQDGWDTQADGEVFYPNAGSPPPAVTRYLEFHVLPGKPETKTVGDTNSQKRARSLLVISIRVLRNTGLLLTCELADKVVDIFEDQQFVTGTGGVIHCYEAHLVHVGGSDPTYFQSDVEIEYDRDQYKL